VQPGLVAAGDRALQQCLAAALEANRLALSKTFSTTARDLMEKAGKI
jgi:hypothetical protein